MLINLIFEIDPFVCPDCGGHMRIISIIDRKKLEVMEKKRFFGGFKNNTNLLDQSVPMDVNPWAVLALGLSGTHDYKRSLEYVENANGNPGTLQNPRYKHTLPYGNGSITAYDFDWESTNVEATGAQSGGGLKGPDIWFEGSFFMSCAYQMAGDSVKAESIISELIKKQGKDGSKAGGLPYCLNGTNNNYWAMAKTNCVSSTGWLVIAAKKWNPFTGKSLVAQSTAVQQISQRSALGTIKTSMQGNALSINRSVVSSSKLELFTSHGQKIFSSVITGNSVEIPQVGTGVFVWKISESGVVHSGMTQVL